MPIDEENPELNESQSEVLNAVSIGMKEVASEAAKQQGTEMLKLLLPALLAGPLAAGSAAMVVALIEGIFKETKSTDRKLDKLLGEPFKTARNTLKEILSEEVRNDAEQAYAARRLEGAAERLATAYSLAEEERPEKRQLVLVYRCLVVAFLDGGGAAMRSWLEEFRELAVVTRKKADYLTADAGRVEEHRKNATEDAVKLYNISKRLDQRHGLIGASLDIEEAVRIDLDVTKVRAQKAARLATDLGDFCALVEFVYENRITILRSPKHRPLLARIRHKLFMGS